MKLKNYRPREMREVEYFGVKISIPADHEWVATDASGGVDSYCEKPFFLHFSGCWHGHGWQGDSHKTGEAEEIRKEDAKNSLRHYPIGEQA